MKQSIIRIIFIFFILFPAGIHAQQNFRDPKQTNENGKDVLADAPWRMKRTDDSGNIAGVPIHVFIKDADGLGSNAELINLNIYIKSASDTAFGNPVTFETYTDSAFLSLFSSKSVEDASLDIQSFDASLPVKDSNYTIQFTANDCVWPDDCQYVDITHNLWYFTITIPPEKLTGLEDIVDIHVCFSLNWDTDDETYLRVFRYDDDLPELQNWYRGDAHYHTVYTNNTAEFGLPLEATKETAKAVGLDWISSTNHSCDYDNYGISMHDNWNRETSEIQTLNSLDTSMIFIHGMEASVINSSGSTVHLLSYPNSASPYAIPYLGDGNGDLLTTEITIDDFLDSLNKYEGFSYAAHPFAEGDQLSSLVDGGIWNVGDIDFLANGSAIAGYSTVICNNTSFASDIYSVNSTAELFKNMIKGGEIWNYRNAMATTDEQFDPWNVTYDGGITPFSLYGTTDTYAHYNRLITGFEVTKFLLKKGLKVKNSDNTLQNYRFYFSAGSDAHGDFNYSNTAFVYGVTGDISNAAIGKPSTLVYCPSGMGNAGCKVLSSFEKGNVIISDGPIISKGLDIDNDQQEEYICGDEALPDQFQYLNAKIRLRIANTPEFGDIQECRLIFGTQEGEHEFLLNIPPSAQNHEEYFSLDSLMTQMEQYDTIHDHEYFYLRAELQSHKNYGAQSIIYCDTAQDYHAFTNPLWIRKPAVFVGNSEFKCSMEIKCFPNPFTDVLNISFITDESVSAGYKIYDITGKLIDQTLPKNFPKGKNECKINVGDILPGIYTLQLSINNMLKNIKIAKLNDSQ